MKIKSGWFILFIVLLSGLQSGMADRSQYDEEARRAEREEKTRLKEVARRKKHPVQNVAEGLKQATVDSAAGLLSETEEGTLEEEPVVGTLEGARRGTEKVLDNTVKGAVKVATLGYGEVNEIEVEDPERGSPEDTTKIKIKIPGT